MTERVIITGVSGFVGGSLARNFAGRGLAVTGLSRRAVSDLPAPVRVTSFGDAELAALIDELAPTIIIHAAGSASVASSITDPGADFDAQVTLFQRVLDGVRRSKHRPRVVFLSSAAVYGNPERLPVAEDAPLLPISPYGQHKVAAEALARDYAERHGIPTLVVRLFSLFGPGQRRLLLWELFEQFRGRAEVVVDGTGDEARDYLHVDDVARALLAVLPKIAAPMSTLNVASGTSITVRELADRIGRTLNSATPVRFRGHARPGSPARWQADVSQLARLAGSFVPGDFNEHLTKTLQQWLA